MKQQLTRLKTRQMCLETEFLEVSAKVEEKEHLLEQLESELSEAHRLIMQRTPLSHSASFAGAQNLPWSPLPGSVRWSSSGMAGDAELPLPDNVGSGADPPREGGEAKCRAPSFERHG